MTQEFITIGHSQLPWKSQIQKTAYGANVSVFDSQCLCIYSINDASECDYKDAQFIVKACNNHDALVSLLKRFIHEHETKSSAGMEFATLDAIDLLKQMDGEW